MFSISLLFVAITHVRPAEMVQIEVDRDDNTFRLSAEFLVDAQPETIKRRLTDYEHLMHLNRSLQESVVLRQIDSRNALVRIVIRTCLAFYCVDLTQVQQFTVGERALQAAFIPDQGDFRSGWVHWRFLPEGSDTRVSLDAQLQPDFWIPPIIGIFLVKRYIRKQALSTLDAIERLNREEKLRP